MAYSVQHFPPRPKEGFFFFGGDRGGGRRCNLEISGLAADEIFRMSFGSGSAGLFPGC